MDEPAVRDALSVFDLSESAIGVYLAVLDRERATTHTVAEATDIPEQTLQEPLDQLAERCLLTIDVDADAPTVRARPPDEARALLSRRLGRSDDGADGVSMDRQRSLPRMDVLDTSESVLARVRHCIDEATDEVLLILPANAFDDVAEDLADAVERDVPVYCMLAAPDAASVYHEIADPGRYATVVRTWDARPPLFALRDDEAGVHGSYTLLTGEYEGGYAIAFNQPEVASAFYGTHLGNVWPMGVQRFVSEPPELPATYTLFRSGVIGAALHDNTGRDVVADLEMRAAETGEELSLERVPLREVRQHLVEPGQSSFPLEMSLVVELDDGLATVGGQTSGVGPFYEEYAGSRITVREA